MYVHIITYYTTILYCTIPYYTITVEKCDVWTSRPEQISPLSPIPVVSRSELRSPYL